jgi:4-alpha-glucanotransferase
VQAAYFDTLAGTSDRFVIAPAYLSEGVICNLNEPQSVKDGLLKAYWNRVFCPDTDGKTLWPYWYWYDAPVYFTLPEHERYKIRALIGRCEGSQEGVWRENGRKLLSVLKNETDMLVCAEDLGVVPDCVPQVLSELGILSLRVERWARDYKAGGAPYVQAKDYPRLSVCTTSSHDSSTLRGLWEEHDFDRSLYWKSIGLGDNPPETLDPGAVQAVLSHLFMANSLVALVPLQDYLALSAKWQKVESPEQERVNIPGQVGPQNWSWRSPASVEDLLADKALALQVGALVEKRKQREG